MQPNQRLCTNFKFLCLSQKTNNDILPVFLVPASATALFTMPCAIGFLMNSAVKPCGPRQRPARSNFLSVSAQSSPFIVCAHNHELYGGRAFIPSASHQATLNSMDSQTHCHRRYSPRVSSLLIELHRLTAPHNVDFQAAGLVHPKQYTDMCVVTVIDISKRQATTTELHQIRTASFLLLQRGGGRYIAPSPRTDSQRFSIVLVLHVINITFGAAATAPTITINALLSPPNPVSQLINLDSALSNHRSLNGFKLEQTKSQKQQQQKTEIIS